MLTATAPPSSHRIAAPAAAPLSSDALALQGQAEQAAVLLKALANSDRLLLLCLRAWWPPGAKASR